MNRRKPTFVLVHGAWHGAWCWARVLPLLRSAGFEAHAITLTGVGERAHLLSNEITLATHIQDVLNLISAEELQSIVLVGHSYGGRVITGVADALLEHGRAHLHHLVYLDAMVPCSGEAWSSTHSPEVIAARVKSARDYEAVHGVAAIVPPDASVFGLMGEDAAWVNRRQTPQPLGVYLGDASAAFLQFDEARLATQQRTFIDCTSPALSTIDVSRRRVREQKGWKVIEMMTGHDPMVSHPSELALLLLGCTE